ncbi:beta-N-acetylhexosaminidase [Shewanella surugensis]|uniref:Beta-hexosaminidase n=1 Tax=Shewanella surugensis TaxID=212020 RepID=A0ABT0L8D2_9GAMM|nr:beta-N-acetylhexosaminidase [Shewanella surugensis]MCL1123905.1 beta-N-acetylhexosaminidase [Shewanella surugensis]
MSYLMLDLSSTQLSATESAKIINPKVGGVILFSRNFADRSQLIELVLSIRRLRPELLIAVDHEGGRVQRFREGFTAIPAMGHILLAAEHDLSVANIWARELGFLMAIELLACDIDLSFAPVLDVNGISEVIGLRSFSPDPKEVSVLAEQFILGMEQAGMAAVGKHFPGHGSVAADSHIAKPVDHRDEATIEQFDMLPFKELIAKNCLQGIMPAHVIYPKVDPAPAGFSSYWLYTVLREKLGFDGVIFSDDLGMKGASIVGDYCQRAKAALEAGCNMILVCNDPLGVEDILAHFEWPISDNNPSHNALSLQSRKQQMMMSLENLQRWQAAKVIAENVIEANR